MKSRFTSIRYSLFVILCSNLYATSAQAISAFQEQFTFSYAKNLSLGNSNSSKTATVKFKHYKKLVNPFAGPVDEAAFLNHIGSAGVDVNFVRLNTDVAGGIGNREPDGIGYLFQYTHITPNKPLTASLRIGKQSIEDNLINSNTLLEGTIKWTTLSFGLYLDESSHINLTSVSQKTRYLASGNSIPETSANTLTLRYKKVWVNAAKKSFNLELSYQKADLPQSGTAKNFDLTRLGIITDVYFSSQTKFGLGFLSNTDKSPNGSNSNSFKLRGSFYFSGLHSIGFNYINTNFDASIDNEKSFTLYYTILLM